MHSVNGIYAGINFRSYIQELLPRGNYEEWAGDDHIRHLKQVITPADRALLVAHFLRAVHPLNYFLSPGTSHQATRPDIGESALVQQYVRYQFGQIYGEQLLTELEHLLMLEPQLEIAAGQVAGDTLLPLTVEWNARKKLSPAGAATMKAKDIKAPKTAKRIEIKAHLISNLPPAYSRLFERYRDQQIGVFAVAVFEQLFADGRISTYLLRLQDETYSRQQLSLYVPVLARRREKIKEYYRHYVDPIIYEGHEYYLGSQWNNGLREKLESWLTDTVFSQDIRPNSEYTPNPFNPDGRYDGSYEGMFKTLIILGDTVTVHLNSHEFLTPEDLASQAANTAAHYDLATKEVENALYENKLPALVGTCRLGTVLDGQTVRVYLLAND